MRIYSTFDGFKNTSNPTAKLIWNNIVDETGKEINGIIFANQNDVFRKYNMKFGNRYLIYFDKIEANHLIGVKKIKLIKKNPTCDIFRKALGEFHIIKGKYKNKKINKIPKKELISYCVWLCENTENEATVRNCLNILNNYN